MFSDPCADGKLVFLGHLLRTQRYVLFFLALRMCIASHRRIAMPMQKEIGFCALISLLDAISQAALCFRSFRLGRTSNSNDLHDLGETNRCLGITLPLRKSVGVKKKAIQIV